MYKFESQENILRQMTLVMNRNNIRFVNINLQPWYNIIVLSEKRLGKEIKGYVRDNSMSSANTLVVYHPQRPLELNDVTL